jgi:hypothetical protein
VSKKKSSSRYAAQRLRDKRIDDAMKREIARAERELKKKPLRKVITDLVWRAQLAGAWKKPRKGKK